jgi:glycosyltransferase involved in cell wall biosynthesis
MIRLHILGIPHTITRSEYSHCAFTGKVLRFPAMMKSRGYEVYHYGVETSETEATEEIQVLSKLEWEALRIQSSMILNPKWTLEETIKRLNDPKLFVGDLGNWDTPLYKEFNKRLAVLLKANYRDKKTDLVCLPFGPAHEDAIKNLDVVTVETGIGYPNSYKSYRIFESYSQMHWMMAKEGKNTQNYWFVCPNYYNIKEWTFQPSPFPLEEKPKIGFLGRICNIKGCDVITETAKKFPHVDFILCGQGDPDPYMKSPNIIYKPPIHGIDRSIYLGSLTALLAPSYFPEPFCGVSVEAQLCGTPVITTECGAVVETVEAFKTGLHCHTLADFCHGIQMALDGKFDRTYIAQRAIRLYDMYNVAKKYDYTFKNILDVHNGTHGWYSNAKHIELIS